MAPSIRLTEEGIRLLILAQSVSPASKERILFEMSEFGILNERAWIVVE